MRELGGSGVARGKQRSSYRNAVGFRIAR
jgi:hypothetical protein